MPQIGLLNEKSLHAALKEWYARPGDRFEVAVDGFVIDIVRNDLLVEIQTGNFAPIKAKLKKLLVSHQVRLICPIAQEKWIVKRPGSAGGKMNRRKSPRRGRPEDLFRHLVSIPQLLSHPGFSLEVLMISEEEVRFYDGRRNWRRKGWATEERRLLDVHKRMMFESPDDYCALLPKNLNAQFTTGDIVRHAGIPINLAQRMAYCLSRTEAIALTGKRGRYNLYEIAGEAGLKNRS